MEISFVQCLMKCRALVELHCEYLAGGLFLIHIQKRAGEAMTLAS